MRDRTEIMFQILTCCAQGRHKTGIMYKTNLNYDQLRAYLNFLTSTGLLLCDLDEYLTTEKGQRFMQAFTELKEIIMDQTETSV